MNAVLRPALGALGATLGATMLGLAALAAVTVAATLVPVFARTWLMLFAIVGAAPVGATVLLMISALTGGLWGEAWRPVLAPLAIATALAALAFLPIAVSLPSIYPWAADPGAAPPDVARLYLNPPLFLLRAAVALGGWSVLGCFFGLGRPSPLVAGLGLAFHGLVISLVAVDWFLSVEPGFVQTDFAAAVAIGQMAAALAIVAVLGAADPVRPCRPAARSRGDLGALLIATQVGIGYLALMAFIIAWYGDLPETIRWYVTRAAPGWLALLLAALAAGIAIPFGILLRQEWRAGGTPLAIAGASALLGLALYRLWLIGPALGPLPTSCAAAALAVPAGLLAFGRRMLLRRREANRGA